MRGKGLKTVLTNRSTSVVPILHYVKNLARKTPGGVIGHSQLTFEFQRRHRVLALGQKMDRQKPGGEGKLRSREDRSGRERGLMVAGMALIPPDRQQAETVMVEGRTAMPEHRLPALRLGSEWF